MLQNLTEALAELKKLLPKARTKARKAREVMKQPGYHDYRLWVSRQTAIPKPNLNDYNPDKYLAECLFKAGMAYGATYFEGCLLDQQDIKAQQARLEKELLEEQTLIDLDDE